MKRCNNNNNSGMVTTGSSDTRDGTETIHVTKERHTHAPTLVELFEEEKWGSGERERDNWSPTKSFVFERERKKLIDVWSDQL